MHRIPSVAAAARRLFYICALSFPYTMNAATDDTKSLLQNEDLAVLCAAMYEYQRDLEGFDINLLETKRHLIGQHMLNIPGNVHHGDKKYFEAKVASVKDSLGTMAAERKAELEYKKWSQAGNPCDQIVALTFILESAESVKTGKGMSQYEARIILKKIYPWDDRYAVILNKGLDVQYAKAGRNTNGEQDNASEPAEKTE
jgi:hypothetical protein